MSEIAFWIEKWANLVVHSVPAVPGVVNRESHFQPTNEEDELGDEDDYDDDIKDIDDHLEDEEDGDKCDNINGGFD